MCWLVLPGVRAGLGLFGNNCLRGLSPNKKKQETDFQWVRAGRLSLRCSQVPLAPWCPLDAGAGMPEWASVEVVPKIMQFGECPHRH